MHQQASRIWNWSVTLAMLVIMLLANGLTSVSAQAGDFASRQILGFTQDGSLFAFEEYGIQDGSGFPYSNIYVIETATDRWRAGSPYRARIDNESASLEQARNHSRAMAGALLDQFTVAGTINATNQPLEVSPTPRRMEARPYFFNPPTDETIVFEIRQYPLAASGDLAEACESFGVSKGFELVRSDVSPPIVLHRDERLPSSRGCPLDYRFADIVSFEPRRGEPMILAILVLYESVGFEGPDGRFLAVTMHEGER